MERQHPTKPQQLVCLGSEEVGEVHHWYNARASEKDDTRLKKGQ